MRQVMLSLIVAVTAIVPQAIVVAQEAGMPSAEERTEVHYFIPYRLTELDPGLTVIAEESGAACDPVSRVAPYRPDARRCFSESQIYDPCFEGPSLSAGVTSELVCVATPFDTEVVLLVTDGPLPPPAPDRDFSGNDPWPWILELANGERCGIAIGAMPLLAGKRVNYTCEQSGWVIGDIDRSQPRWVVNYLAPSGRVTESVDVTARWY